jgi:hypothetical protein
MSAENVHEFVAKSDKDVWQSPPDLWVPIAEHCGGIEVDPCPGPTTQIAAKNIRLPRNGLIAPWHVRGADEVTAYINPPFSQKKKWLREAVGRYERGEIDRAFLVTPDSTDVISWWHEWIVPNCRYTWFPEGRVEYVDPDPDEDDSNSGVSFGTAVSVLGDLPASLWAHWNENGDVVRRYVEG